MSLLIWSNFISQNSKATQVQQTCYYPQLSHDQCSSPLPGTAGLEMELLSRWQTVAEKKKKDKNIAGHIPAFLSRNCQWGGRCKKSKITFISKVSEAESLSLATSSVTVFCLISPPSHFFTCWGCLFKFPFSFHWSFYWDAYFWGTGDTVFFLGMWQAAKTKEADRNKKILILFLSLIENAFRSYLWTAWGVLQKFLGQ